MLYGLCLLVYWSLFVGLLVCVRWSAFVGVLQLPVLHASTMGAYVFAGLVARILVVHIRCANGPDYVVT